MLTDIAEEFSTTTEPNRTLPYDWNIKPTQDIYIIKSERQMEIASWGLIAPWSKNGDDAYRSQSQAINARSETVHEKPTFRSAFRSRRCLIPASGYYEWATALGDYPSKQPFYISRADSHLLAFAGIHDLWTSPEGVNRKSAAIITQDATGDLAKIHNRMPVILPRERWDEWLDPSHQELEELRQLMRVPNPTAGLRFWPVRSLVNSIKNNGAELIEAIELGDPQTLF